MPDPDAGRPRRRSSRPISPAGRRLLEYTGARSWARIMLPSDNRRRNDPWNPSGEPSAYMLSRWRGLIVMLPISGSVHDAAAQLFHRVWFDLPSRRFHVSSTECGSGDFAGPQPVFIRSRKIEIGPPLKGGPSGGVQTSPRRIRSPKPLPRYSRTPGSSGGHRLFGRSGTRSTTCSSTRRGAPSPVELHVPTTTPYPPATARRSIAVATCTG